MKNVSITVVVGLLVIVGVGFLLLLSRSGGDAEDELVTLPVTLEEFSDFQCPACGAYYPVVEEAREEFGEDLNFVFRNFPLTSLHEYAYNSSLAAEAAREQGKFEEYYDLLFSNQEKLTDDDLISYAEQLGLDVEKFKADMQGETVKARVESDIALGREKNITGTPTFFLDGTRIVFSSRDTETPDIKLKRLIKERIEKAKSQITTPTSEQTQ